MTIAVDNSTWRTWSSRWPRAFRTRALTIQSRDRTRVHDGRRLPVGHSSRTGHRLVQQVCAARPIRAVTSTGGAARSRYGYRQDGSETHSRRAGGSLAGALAARYGGTARFPQDPQCAGRRCSRVRLATNVRRPTARARAGTRPPTIPVMYRASTRCACVLTAIPTIAQRSVLADGPTIHGGFSAGPTDVESVSNRSRGAGRHGLSSIRISLDAPHARVPALDGLTASRRLRPVVRGALVVVAAQVTFGVVNLPTPAC